MSSTRGIIELEDETKSDEFTFHGPYVIPFPWPELCDPPEAGDKWHFGQHDRVLVVTAVDPDKGTITVRVVDRLNEEVGSVVDVEGLSEQGR